METIYFPTKLHIGETVLTQLQHYQEERIFIVTDPFMVETSKIQKITQHLEGKNTIEVFSDIIPDPPIETVMAGIESLTAFQPTILLAVGGGSPIDALKAMKFFGMRLERITDLPLIIIPTTSGTGSEVTNFSVITNQEKGVKYPLVTEAIQPDEAYLASELVMTVPPQVTADTGMDVLTHALEAYVSTKATDFSDALCEKVVVLVFDYLVTCYREGENQLAREKMHHASAMAGMAFNLTSLGLNHGIAHAAGAKLHVPHGKINGILLNEVIEYNAGCGVFAQAFDPKIAEKYAYLATLLGYDHQTAKAGVRNLTRGISQLKHKLNMPNSLQAAGVSKETFQQFKEEIIANALLDGCTATNPKQPTKEEVAVILERVKS